MDFKPIPIDLVQIGLDHSHETRTKICLNPVFIYYIFKIKYLRNLWIDFNSVKSSEIAVFSRYKIQKKYEGNWIIITEVMNKFN